MRIITITGATGMGKTLFAEHIESVAKKAGINVYLSDHELSSTHIDYLSNLEKIKRKHLSDGADLSIIVVNDGGNSLCVDFGGSLPHSLFKDLFSI